MARLTSFWVIATDAAVDDLDADSSDTSIFIKESSSASTEPDESPLMTILSMSISDSANFFLKSSRETTLRRLASWAARSVA